MSVTLSFSATFPVASYVRFQDRLNNMRNEVAIALEKGVVYEWFSGVPAELLMNATFSIGISPATQTSSPTLTVDPTPDVNFIALVAVLKELRSLEEQGREEWVGTFTTKDSREEFSRDGKLILGNKKFQISSVRS